MFLKEYKGDMETMKSFVPQKTYGRWCGRNKGYEVLINDKVLFHDIMDYYKLPTPKAVLIVRNGVLYDDKIVVIDDKKCSELLGKITLDKLFLKRTFSGAGKGVDCFVKCEGRFKNTDGNFLTADYLRENCIGGVYFLEEGIVQEPQMAQFNPDTVNTIRILTKSVNGKHEIISASARFGRKGCFIDNMHAGGVACSIDIESGKMGEYAIRRYENKKYYTHPDSNIKFKDFQVPQWQEIKSLVIRTLEHLPYYKSVGFDVATTNDGPIIIEINTGAGMDLAQAGKVIGLAKYMC